MSNHNGNANKMVDTPRTDESIYPINGVDIVWPDFARQLERELNAANDRIKRLEEFVEQLTNPKFTRDDLPKEALLQRIKRLEEAGDAMINEGWNEPHLANAWRKAKEAKP